MAVSEKSARRPYGLFVKCGHRVIASDPVHASLRHFASESRRWKTKVGVPTPATAKVVPSDQVQSIIEMWVGSEGSLEKTVRQLESSLPRVSEAYAKLVWGHTSALPCLEFLPEFEKRFQRIERELTNLRSSCIVVISTFAPEPYDVLRPIYVTLRQSDGEEYCASFADANLHSSGDNEEEAIDNLRSLILDVYDSLTCEKPEDLGSEPVKQLAVLQSFLAKRANGVHPG
jgi:hypothetical protein